MAARRHWARYQTVFDHVGVAARVRRVNDVPNSLLRADGDGVEFLDLPEYTGPWQFLRRSGALRARVIHAVNQHDAFCLRVPCIIASAVWRELRRLRRPYGLEVVGDPWDSLAPGGVKSLVRPLARWIFARNLRAECSNACAIWYVTRYALQRRYPPPANAFHVNFSDIELSPGDVADAPRSGDSAAKRLIFVGTLAVLYKGQDVLIKAVARAGRSGLHLTFVGDGRARSKLEELAASLGIADQVTFLGQLPAGRDVRHALGAADLFVLPSRTEGLPRAMIEAMARGLPCIGSTVGGIPELLAPEDMVPPGDVDALAKKILDFMDDPSRYARASQRNLKAAAGYVATVLEARRTDFYRELRRRSEGTNAE